jgi:hypothetical protein
LTVSGVGFRRWPPFRWQVDNQPPFPDVCVKTKNGFVAGENCFVALGRRNNWSKTQTISMECHDGATQRRSQFGGPIIVKNQKSAPKTCSANGLIRVVQWPSAAMTAGAGVTIGDPQ